jgi:formate hydrogenlyase transcriptional activator
MVYWAYRNQQTAVISSVERETRFPASSDNLKRIGVRSLCAIPLNTAHRQLGAISFGSEAEDTFPDEEVRFLTLVAGQVALAMDDALNFQESQRANGRLRLLLDLTNRIVSTLDLRDLLRELAAAIRRVMDGTGASVALPDPETGRLRLYAVDFPTSKGHVQEGVTFDPSSDVERVFRTGRTATLSEEEIANEPIARAEGIKSLCHFPVIGRDRVLGVATVSSSRRDDFLGDDADFLSQVANQIAIAVENALAYSQIAELKDKLAREKVYLEDEIRTELNFEEIVGQSEALRHVLRQIETVAPTDSTVLIYGETGTGKELIARAVHNLSSRKSSAFVKLNCAAIPTGLLESELFGHEKGAFTGAIAPRVGRFELAHRGTIFLDEVGEIPLELQPKLLRVLQEREFERLGSSRTVRSDARLIAATNRDLEQMVEEQRFRSDLFYRLNVFPVRIPPLRERQEDIPLLVRHFTQQFSRRNQRGIDTIPSGTMDALVQYHWPGNIRELQNVIERAVIVSKGPVLNVPVTDLKPAASAAKAGQTKRPAVRENLRDALSQSEREQIMTALEQSDWVVAGPDGAAARLGMKRSTLQFRMRKLGIEISRSPV